MQQFFECSEEVEDALQAHTPILALESSLITQGLPEKINLETARGLEKIARELEVTPATIAILDGKIKIGLTDDELERLATEKGAMKASRRDLPYLLGKKVNAGTTVAATLFCADYAGIRIFATGGIGGVHRGDSFDISADLTELSRTPMAVICSGAKAILDIPRTLEFLETYSIPIVGYQTSVMPAFYSAETAYELPARAEDVEELMRMLRIHWQLGLPSGFVIANPIPEKEAIAAERIEPAIEKALKDAKAKKISGKAMTPYLLGEVSALTAGESLAANVELIKNNVRLGAELARLA